MKRKLSLVASAVLTAATAASLIFAGAGTASAKPVTPRSPSNSSLSFVVPQNPAEPDQPLRVQFSFTLGGIPEDDSRAYKVDITCDDGYSLPIDMHYDLSGFRGGSFASSFPVSEQGHTCTLHGKAPAERILDFLTPRIEYGYYNTGPDGKAVPFLRIYAAPTPVYNYPGAR